MIPKIIHYCWFGKNDKPKLAKKCIKSWNRYCKDYRIIEWNEENFDIETAPRYVREAYDAKKWAFVTDYVRLWALIQYGGIYMDTDVEVTQNLDQFLSHTAFSGFESNNLVPTGIMGGEKGFLLFEEFLKEYDTVSFIREDGTFDMTPNVTRITNLCERYGLNKNDEYQVVNGFALYPHDWFCPKHWDGSGMDITENTHTIHHFSASWWDEETKKRVKKKARQAQFAKVRSKLKRAKNRFVGAIISKIKQLGA